MMSLLKGSLFICTSPLGFLKVFRVGGLTSLRTSDLRDQGKNYIAFYFVSLDATDHLAVHCLGHWGMPSSLWGELTQGYEHQELKVRDYLEGWLLAHIHLSLRYFFWEAFIEFVCQIMQLLYLIDTAVIHIYKRASKNLWEIELNDKMHISWTFWSPIVGAYVSIHMSVHLYVYI